MIERLKSMVEDPETPETQREWAKDRLSQFKISL
jgi:hypothetical protein